MKPSLSIVMPHFRRVDELRVSLAFNRRWLHDGIEIVISNDDPSDHEHLMQLANEYSARWRIVQNPNAHEWRNPAKAINVGIRHARADVVLIVSPETRFVSDVPKILLAAANMQPCHYHFGEVAFSNEATVDTFCTLKRLSCGSLCASKHALFSVHGYDERLIGWGGDDDNIRARLRLSGIFGVRHESAMLLHPCMSGSHRRYSEDTKSRLREIVKPSKAQWAHDAESWGMDFNHVILDTHPA